MDKDSELFKNITFSDLMSDVYHNSKKMSRQFNQLVSQLLALIKNASDATVIVPLIKEYLDVAVKNDDQLVKLTAIVQRYISTKQTISGDDGILSAEEKEELLKLADTTFSIEFESEIDKLNSDAKTIKKNLIKSEGKDVNESRES